jgi:pimeloyl-ACP methyl ester carboxylesterase
VRLRVAGNDVYVYSGARAPDPALPSVVFVHGAAQDHSVWTLQSRYFAHHRWNVLSVDLPGHGRSAGPALPSVEAIADWIAALLDAAATGEAVLVGHSLGALAVLEAAGRHPERVPKLVLLGAAVPMAVSDVLLDAARADDPVALELITGWSHSAGSRIGGNPMPGMWMTGHALRLMERARPGVLHVDLMACHGYAGGLQAAAGVACPTLLLQGGRDLMAPPKAAQPLRVALPAARVVTLPGCGHALMAERPDAVLEALVDFLSA